MSLSDTNPIPFALVALTGGEYHGAMTQGMIEARNEFSGADPDVLLTTIVLEAHGPYLEVGRNKSIKRALADESWRWALLVDSDIGMHAEHVKAIVMAGEAAYQSRANGDEFSFKSLVHTGVYANFLAQFPDVQAAVADLHAGLARTDPDEFDRRHAGRTEKCAVLFDQFDIPYGSMPDEPSRGVMFHPISIPRVDLPPFQVDCAGAGFLLIHRDIFTNFLNFFTFTYLDDTTNQTVTVPSPSPWFDEVLYRGATLGEDVTFCMRVRALGGDITVHPGIHVTHHKTMAISCH